MMVFNVNSKAESAGEGGVVVYAAVDLLAAGHKAVRCAADSHGSHPGHYRVPGAVAMMMSSHIRSGGGQPTSTGSSRHFQIGILVAVRVDCRKCK